MKSNRRSLILQVVHSLGRTRRESNRGLQNRVMGLEGTQKNTFSNELEHELFIVKGSQSCRVLKYVNIKTSCPDDLIVLKPYSAMKVEEEGIAFHTENQMPPTVAILDLGCTRAMGSRNAINAFCDYVDTHDCGPSPGY